MKASSKWLRALVATVCWKLIGIVLLLKTAYESDSEVLPDHQKPWMKDFILIRRPVRTQSSIRNFEKLPISKEYTK